jgi:hypothetical protein
VGMTWMESVLDLGSDMNILPKKYWEVMGNNNLF